MPKILTRPVLEQLADRFKVLGEVNRLTVLSALRQGEHTVTELIDETGLGQANLSKHLTLLHRLGFVSRRKEGLNVYYSLADEDVFSICDIMCGRLDREAAVRRSALRGRAGRSPRR
jgi:DNA-binding transcriptional ArsR family regulator